MKEKIVYTRWVANKLVREGFPVVRVMQNPNHPEFDCYVFADTNAFRLAFMNIANKPR